ncbi:MAG: extensin family protein [Pseudomonadota bacterium]
MTRLSASVAVALLALGSCGNGDRGADLARALDLGPDVGAICGSSRILGTVPAPVEGRGGCGINAPVRVHAVGQVLLRPPALVNCRTAEALEQWQRQAAEPAAAAIGERLVELQVAASYACRRRNNRSTGRLSEHARGNAIDISAFRFADGDSATVTQDWRGSAYTPMLRQMHSAACGPFGVVLGPDADRYHQNHFHFDVSHLNRPFCR